MKLSRNELASVRARQKLRFNSDKQCWEVYTFVAPNTNDFRWYAISVKQAGIYKNELRVPVVPYVAETAPATASNTSESTPTKETNHDHSTP